MNGGDDGGIGCGTCKAKRLKCDESKPTCHQCQKRGVACAGYKKDFKWRPFEEGSFGARAQKGPRKGTSARLFAFMFFSDGDSFCLGSRGNETEEAAATTTGDSRAF